MMIVLRSLLIVLVLLLCPLKLLAQNSKCPVYKPSDCYITTNEIRQWQKDKNFRVVDIRPAESYQKVHIPGALNLPLFAIKAKEPLKSKKVLLVDNAYKRRELETSCKELKKSGFKELKILKGGLLFWHKHIAKLKGEVIEINDLKSISVPELFSEIYFRPWLLIDVSTNPKELQLESVKQINYARYSPQKDFLAGLKELIGSERKNNPELSVALYRNSTKADVVLESLLLKLNLIDVYYVLGGRQALRAYASGREKTEAQKRRAEELRCH